MVARSRITNGLLILAALLFHTNPSFANGAGTCLRFDGFSSYAEGSGFTSPLTNFTIEIWIYPISLPSAIKRIAHVWNEVIVLEHDGSSQQGQLHFFIRTDGVQRDIRVNDALQINRWHHIAGTWDGTTQRLYLNGEEIGSNTPGGSLNAPSGSVRLTSPGAPFQGFMDEYRIWSVAHTKEEIRQHMFKALSGSEPGLEGYWNLDEGSGTTAYDNVGSTDLTLHDMDNTNWDNSGAFAGPRNALDFDGMDDYVNCGNDPSLTEFDDFTMEAWVWLQNSGNDQKVLGKFKDWDNYYFMGVGSGTFYSQLKANGQEINFSTGAVPSQEWTHLAVTFSKGSGGDNGTCLAYINGGLVYSKTDVSDNAISVGSATFPFRIGVAPWDVNAFAVDGLIDDVRIWNTSRTSQEIRDHMCQSLAGDESGLAAYYRFDQNDGTALFDWSDNSNNGTLANMTDDDWVGSTAYNMYIGFLAGDWGNAGNWSRGIVPNSTLSNVGVPVYPGGTILDLLSNDYVCNHLSVCSGTEMRIRPGYTLTVNGNAFVSGNTDNSGKLVLSGSSSTHSMFGTFENIELYDSEGARLEDDATVNGTLTLTDGTFSLGANTLTLKNSIGGTTTNLEADSTSSITIAGSGAGIVIPGSVTELNNMTLNNSNGTILQNDLELDGTLTLTSGDLDLNGHTLTLGATATLSETDGNTVTGDSGIITTTRTFNAGDLSGGVNIAGMGAEITTDAALGQMVISRGHTEQTIDDVASILRYYDLTPANNSGLDATIVFHYDESELCGWSESSLSLYCSADSCVTWLSMAGVVDTLSNTIALSGVDSLSLWTASGGFFTEMTDIPLAGVYRSSVAWGDYDNDGDLDVLLTGFANIYVSIIYRNDGSDTFTDINAGLPGVINSSAAWGDYDNDGDLDVLLTGYMTGDRIARIYRNDGSDTFTDIGAGLPGVNYSSVAWGDYDNDGDLDVLLTGYSDEGGIARIYRNDGSDTFTDITAGLPGVNNSSVAWGDYDNDDDLDILLTGYGPGVGQISHIYSNAGGGAFTHTVSLPGVDWSSVAWGDYDSDGDLDILITGDRSGGYLSGIFRNDLGDTFTEMTGISLVGVDCSSAAWGDYDNDGDLDILLTGNTGTEYVSVIYRNDGLDTFTELSPIPLIGVYHSSVSWGDYDNDDDLDILLTGHSDSGIISRIYRNNSRVANTAPAAPSNLSASTSGQTAVLSWDRPTDAQTAQNALTYNLRIGTSSGGVEIMSPMADVTNGYRRIPALGNTNHNTSWTINGLSPGWHHWSVQAIDNSFAGSPFAVVDSFYCLGTEFTLTGTVQLDTLVLEWNTVSPASTYWIYRDFNDPYFDPQVESPFAYRQAVTADTTWSSPAGIADPDTNWTYQVIAVDGSESELTRSNRVAEHEFLLP